MQAEGILKYRGRIVSADDVALIRDLIARHPSASRVKLSRLLCEAWAWKQANGAPSDILCRGLMLALHRAGHILLPPPRFTVPNNIVRRRVPEPVPVDTSAIRGALSDLQPLRFVQVRRTPLEKIADGLIQQYHYLRYIRPVGEHVKFLVFSRAERPVACLMFSSAPRHLGPRDRFIGWSPAARRGNIRFIAYNPRFLIPPWIEVPHLASHVLGRVARILPEEWRRVYGHPVYFLETFVDPTRYRGTCYRASNWVLMGRTTGRGKNDQTNKPNRSIKDVWGYPLVKHFRELLSAGAAP
jgi:hypothetical protein